MWEYRLDQAISASDRGAKGSRGTVDQASFAPTDAGKQLRATATKEREVEICQALGRRFSQRQALVMDVAALPCMLMIEIFA